MCAIPQLVSAPLNPIPILQNILGGATHNVSTVTSNTYSCFEKGCRKKCTRLNPKGIVGGF